MVLTAFKFHNLLGTVYAKGNLLFTADGHSILSPVGNRVAVFDLVNNKSRTLSFENRKPIARIALSPDANILLSIDQGPPHLCTFLPIPLTHSQQTAGLCSSTIRNPPSSTTSTLKNLSETPSSAQTVATSSSPTAHTPKSGKPLPTSPESLPLLSYIALTPAIMTTSSVSDGPPTRGQSCPLLFNTKLIAVFP